MNKQFNHYQQFLSDIPCSVSVVRNDEDFTILYANNEFYALIGLSAEEIQYKYANKLGALLDIKTLKQLNEAFSGKTQDKRLEIQHHVKVRRSSELYLYSALSLSHLQEEAVIYILSYDMSYFKNIETELHAYKKKVGLLFESTPLDLIDYDKNTGEICHINEKGFFNHFLQKGDHFANTILENELVHPDHSDSFSNCISRIEQGEKRVLTELQFKGADGKHKWIMLSLCQEVYNDKTVVSAIINNITAEKEATLNYLNEALFYQAMLSSTDAYGHLDITEDKILRLGGLWNLYSELMDKITFTALSEEFIYKVVHTEDRAQYIEIMTCDSLSSAYHSGVTQLTCEFRRIVEQNKMVWMRITVQLFENPINQHLMGLLYLNNIDLQKRQQSLLEYESGHDALTNLHNKSGAINLIKEYRAFMKDDEYCALILLDIDNFHDINRLHGYEMGDQILMSVSLILSNAFRKYDVIGRLGGDEFLVFVKNIEDSKSVEDRLDTVNDCLKTDMEIPVTMSMGVAYANKGDRFEHVLHKCRVALQDAKDNGRNRYCTYVAAKESLDSENKLDCAEEDFDNTKAFLETLEETSSSDEFSEFLGEYGEMAYLVDPSTFNLICGNKAFYDRIGKTDVECTGLKCYEVIHHRTHPCPFCGNVNWTTDRFYMYRNFNEVLEQEFLIKNKLIQWHSKEVLFALAIDLSNDKSTLELMENSITEDRAVISGIQHMQLAEDIEGVMQSGMDAIAKFFRADIVQIWIWDSERESYANQHTWVKGNAQQTDFVLDPSETQLVDTWLQNRKWADHFVVENKEQMLCSSYELYQRMVKYNFSNESWFLLKDDNDTEIGIIEIDNISVNFQNVSFLHSFLTFVSSEWNNRKMLKALILSGFYDKLTGLLNHASYERFLSEFCENDVDSIGVIYINIDGLKKINDSLGYQTGNSYILQLADVLGLIFPDRQKYRLSGDEFMVLLTDVAQKEVEYGISRLQDVLSDLKLFTVSVGYAWDNLEKDPAVLAEYANQNMKINKARYHASLETDSNERAELLGWTMTAIEEERLLVYLQPKVDIRTGEVIGAEALVRYKDKQDGIVPPVKFIPPLERSNLIRYIDFFVFEEVCKTLKIWKEKGWKCPVISFNFSRITMSENDLITNMEKIIDKYGTSKDSIEVEITESYADIGKALLNQAARSLHRAGYPITLDDFGTKYTNLSILSEIDTQILKIDKSLVHSIEDDAKAQIILKNVIQMCRELQIEIIAEGVETEKQKNILESLGCYYVQGFLYSKPISIAEFESSFL